MRELADTIAGLGRMSSQDEVLRQFRSLVVERLRDENGFRDFAEFDRVCNNFFRDVQQFSSPSLHAMRRTPRRTRAGLTRWPRF